MHVFPQLRKLEEKYPGELVVIGVHSAKFTTERETENVRRAVLRYEIEHPVVNDTEFLIWRRYGVRAWPTLVFIDPQGNVIGRHEGEFPYEAMDDLIARLTRAFKESRLIDHTPLPVKLERDKEKDGALSFPGKVLADARGGRLFIADSNHNRIVVTSPTGLALEVIGSGNKGLLDGAFAQAQFNDPQGMALDGGVLYVADTKNHAVRRVDLRAKVVATVAGTGQQAMMFHHGGAGGDTSLNSPWDLTLHDGTLYIAMAGFHQIWRMDLATYEVRPHAGSGRERIVDGALAVAELAQPSGITTDGQRLYFTDSETSSVRMADLSPEGQVTSIVGLDLFTFGDVDGVAEQVRLQHPLGVAMYNGTLLIADTYNNKIKQVIPTERRALSLLGNGLPGHRDGPGPSAQFHEPGGLSVAHDKLYVADTNNHAIRLADLSTGQVSTLEIRFLP